MSLTLCILRIQIQTFQICMLILNLPYLHAEISSLLANKTYHGVCLDKMFNLNPNCSIVTRNEKKEIIRLVNEGIAEGVFQPINRTVFPLEQCTEAFNYMSSGQHIGEVLIQFRDEIRDSIPRPVRVNGKKKTIFDPQKSYVITGGLG